MNKTSKKSKKRSLKHKNIKLKNSLLKHRWQDWLFITIMSILAYSSLMQNEFVNFDDTDLILENPIIKNIEIQNVFTSLLNTPYYKPMVNISWIIESAIFGFNPKVFHFNNLLIHIFNSILVYLFGYKLVRFWDYLIPFRTHIAFFTALLFALHPMHVESVAWAVERKDVLYTMFYLLGILMYIKFTETRSVKWIIFCACGFLLSILSKGPGITLIAVLFAYDYLAKRKLNANLFIEKTPVIIVFFVGIWVYGLMNNLGSNTLSLAANEGIAGSDSFQTTSSTSGFLYMNFKMLFWIIHSLLPINLSLVYPRVELLEVASKFKYIFLIISIVALIGLYKSSKHNRFLVFCFAFLVITLSPPLVRMDIGTGVFLSDRYMYLPIFAIVTFIIVLFKWMGEKYFSGVKNFAVIGLSLIGLLYFFSSFTMVKVWRNSETLWTNSIKKYPDVPFSYITRGQYYLSQNQAEKALNDLENSVSLISSSSVSDEEWKRAYLARSRAYRGVGKHQEALSDLNLIIKRFPDYLKAYINRGNIYTDLGQNTTAIADYNKVIQKEPNNLKALVGRGAAYGLLRRPNEGLADLNKSLTIDPYYYDAVRAKIIVYYYSGQLDLALENCNLYLKHNPNNTQVINNRNAILKELGR